MQSFLKALVLGSLLCLPLALPGPAQAADDDGYWKNHWNWYDNTYRPYYYRGYNNRPGYYNSYYGPGYGNYYGPGYGGYGYGGYGYGNYYGAPYGAYTGTQNFGYGRTYGGGQALNIGGLRFGWR